MRSQAFDVLRSLEGSWWHYGRRQAIAAAMRKAHVEPSTARVLDVGAGYGSMHDFLSTFGSVDGVERNNEARVASTERGYGAMYADIQNVPVNAYDVVGVFDVIEHIEDDAAFVRALFERLSPGGILVATVPAFQFLWSKHDEVHEHYRRHTVGSMRTLLSGAGFEVRYAKYWNVALFFPVAIMRLLNRGGESALRPHPLIDRVLRMLMDVESRCVPHLPPIVGVSVVVVASRA